MGVIQRCLLGMMIGLLGLTTACQKQEAPDTRAADERAIRAVDPEWQKALAAKDVEKCLSFFADDAVGLYADRAPVTGKDAFRQLCTELVNTPGLSQKFEAARVEVTRSGEQAYAHGTYTMSANGPDGKPIVKKGKWVEVFRKGPDGTWKIVVDVANDDVEAPTPATSKKR